jgi:hypothetical protein
LTTMLVLLAKHGVVNTTQARPSQVSHGCIHAVWASDQLAIVSRAGGIMVPVREFVPRPCQGVRSRSLSPPQVVLHKKGEKKDSAKKKEDWTDVYCVIM